MSRNRQLWLVLLNLLPAALSIGPESRGESPPGPYVRQIAEQRELLRCESKEKRARAAESLGLLRAYVAEPDLIQRLADTSAEVRRQSAMALSWCGSRAALQPLVIALDDKDWLVRQSARVSLTNLTGMEFPFDADAPPATRVAQVNAWHDWVSGIVDGEVPNDVAELLKGDLSRAGAVTASTTYRGPPDILVDGQIGPDYWQTKNVDPPQWCCVDLGNTRDVSQVIVHQYGPGYCMTEFELATSVDDRNYTVVCRDKRVTPPKLAIDFPARPVRFVRITSFGSENPRYPTTFFEIEANGGDVRAIRDAKSVAWRHLRGVRALGSLGGASAAELILKRIGDPPASGEMQRETVIAAIRSLGRLADESSFQFLLRLLDNPLWARNAAEALGDRADSRAVMPLLKAYSRYAKQLDGADPKDVPSDDKMGFPSEDRMLETPYWILYSLCRLPIDKPEELAMLRELAPRFMANLPGDLDTFLLYRQEVAHVLTGHVIERTGRRQEACEHAFRVLGQATRNSPTVDSKLWSPFTASQIASWLPAVCTEREDLPRLVALLDHTDGWVRLNACKALAWLGDPRAIEPLAQRLSATPAEAEFGYSGIFKDEEYNDPAPRVREGLIRALGLLQAHQHVDLLVGILNDQRSVIDVRRAAAEALSDLGDEAAVDALRRAAGSHDFGSIRHVARDALRARGFGAGESHAGIEVPSVAGHLRGPASAIATTDDPAPAIVFIKGDNDVPNTPQTVEQADRWRQTYVVTDEGPTYRPGNNLYVLRPARPDGLVAPLTRFTGGYVADPEVSWDGRDVVFCHRGYEDPWWQVYVVRADGTGLRQLTEGPYHSIQPAWLPDGRIVFASSRVGTRDEYHGYACTALCVMDRDGNNSHLIATNIGRDNEPAVMDDGRIVFSRLEVFYSRNKTELTLHAMRSDGTQDLVLYGPERRAFWRQLDHGDPDPADVQEAPLTHRVLRMTQPQPLPGGRGVIVSTQGGLTLIGPKRDTERLLCPDYRDFAYTTPYPLPDGRVLCAVTRKTPNRSEVDLGIYAFDLRSGQRTLIYNDPKCADYEARPLVARPVPPRIPDIASEDSYSGKFLCASAFASQEPEVARRGRFVRLIEGVPQVARHSTQTNPEPVWKNHGGTLARVLGVAPLAADGSFYAEVPADRLLHLQVLDSDRRVVGNQLTWIYSRPGETKSCVGCHEPPHATSAGRYPRAATHAPLDFLPRGDEFVYRGKAWFKGSLPAAIEEGTRTVRAVNLLAR
jgi:HEAT repeat protein